MAEVKINVDDCIGCGICVKKSPEGYEINDEMKAVVKNPNAPGIKEGADDCPTNAIEVIGELAPAPAAAPAPVAAPSYRREHRRRPLLRPFGRRSYRWPPLSQTPS